MFVTNRAHQCSLCPGLLFALLLSAVGSRAEIISANRRIQWDPGIHANGQTFGSAGQFVYPAVYTKTINVKSLGAFGDDQHDDTAAIQAAIRRAPNGSVIYFPPGTYKITDWLVWNYYDAFPAIIKGMVFRGEGPNSTTIKQYTRGKGIFSINGNGCRNSNQQIASGAFRGSTRLLMSAWDPEFKPGTSAMIYQDNSADSNVQGDGRGGKDNYMQNCKAQIVSIRSVDKGAKAITIDTPLYFDYQAPYFGIDPTKVYPGGFENMALVSATNPSSHHIVLSGISNWYVNNIRSLNCYKWHIRLDNCRRCTVYGSWFSHTTDSSFSSDYGGGDSGYGVGLYNRSCDNLVINNVFDYLRHSMVMEYGGEGNVFAYNFSTRPINESQDKTDYLMGDILSHGGHPSWNLWEGNVAATIRFDYVLGSSADNTAFRNYLVRQSLPTVRVACFGADIQKMNHHTNLVGNVWGVPIAGSDSETYRWGTDGDSALLDAVSEQSTYLHGNYDLRSQTVTWNSNNRDRRLPPSLWLTRKPSFFGIRPWPGIGPDLNPQTNRLPAQDRFSGR